MKIVCNFEEVANQVQQIRNSAGEMNTAINTYKADISDNLSGWKGAAKDAFDLTNDEQVQTTTNHVKSIDELADFIEKAYQKIEELETTLAGIKI